MYYDYTFQPQKIIFKMEVAYIALIKLKGNNITPYYLPLNMNKYYYYIYFLLNMK